MDEAIKEIKRIFWNYNFAISWSYVLKKHWIIKRDLGDLDICFPIELKNIIYRICNKNNLPSLGWKVDYGDGREIFVTKIKNIGVDIFFDFDFKDTKKILPMGSTIKLLHPFEIAKKKFDLLLNNSNYNKKHLEDIISICKLTKLNK